MTLRSVIVTDYAVVASGGKQYRIQNGDTVRVESLNCSQGDTIELRDVLLVSKEGNVTVGNPVLTDAKVITKVVSNGRNKKVIVFKYKAKTRYRKKNGHRQNFTDLQVIDISVAETPAKTS